MGCQKLTYGTTENTNLKVVYRARNIAQRFLSFDPLTKKYPHYSPYSFSGNRVIDRIELEGLEEAKFNTTLYDSVLRNSTDEEVKIIREAQGDAATLGLAIITLFTPGPDELLFGAILTRSGNLFKGLKATSKVTKKANDAFQKAVRNADKVNDTKFPYVNTKNKADNVFDRMKKAKDVIKTKNTDKVDIRILCKR